MVLDDQLYYGGRLQQMILDAESVEIEYIRMLEPFSKQVIEISVDDVNLEASDALIGL